MTTSPSETDLQRFRIKNSGKRPLHVMTELWCEEFTIAPGEVLEGTATTSELTDPLNPLTFEIWLEDEHVSLWCPYEAQFELKPGTTDETQ